MISQPLANSLSYKIQILILNLFHSDQLSKSNTLMIDADEMISYYCFSVYPDDYNNGEWDRVKLETI